jgi:hypothetical protein
MDVTSADVGTVTGTESLLLPLLSRPRLAMMLDCFIP